MERPPLGRSLLVALFVAITWGACTFAVAGLLAVLFDRDPIRTPSPTWTGLVGIALAGIVVWLAVGVGLRAARPWSAALLAVAGVYVVVIVAAGFASFALLSEQATSPFVIAGAALAGVAVVATHAVMRRPPNAGLSRSDPRS